MRTVDDVPLTQEGIAKLREELRCLQARRSAKLEEHAALVAAGDGPAAVADHLRHELALLDYRIARLREALARAVPGVEKAGEPGVVSLGSRVTVRWEDGDEEQYTIVGPLEADVRAGRLSHTSPVGRALLGRRKGEEVQVETPGGPRCLQLLAVA